MSITFSSVGDIIAVSLIVKDLIKAFDDSRGSMSEYQGVIRELEILVRVLLEVDQVSKSHDRTMELNALDMTAKRIADACRCCVEGFIGKIQSYGTSLSAQGSAHPIRKVSNKVLWQIAGTGDLKFF